MPVLRHQDISTLCCRLLQPRTGTIWTIDMMGTCDMNHRQETLGTGNAGYPGTKEPNCRYCHCMTAACSLHSADLTAQPAVSGVVAPGALLRSRWWRSGARCAGDRIVAPRVRRTSADGAVRGRQHRHSSSLQHRRRVILLHRFAPMVPDAQ